MSNFLSPIGCSWLLNGTPVRVLMTVTFRFSLDRDL